MSRTRNLIPSFFILTCIMFSVVSAEEILIEKSAPQQIKLNSILIVNLVVHNFQDEYIEVVLRETVTNAEPVDPPELTVAKPRPGIEAPPAPFYEWRFKLSPKEIKNITYKIRPLIPGPLILGSTVATTSIGTFYSNSLTVWILCNQNSICEPDEIENHITCPEDCPSGSKDNICNLIKDGVCDPDCLPEADPDCLKVEDKKPIRILFYFLLLIIILVLLFIILRSIRTGDSRKGMSKMIMSQIFLLVILILIAFFSNRMMFLNRLGIEEKTELKLNNKATSILEILSGSKNCLGYKELGSIEGESKELATHRVLDKRKLDEFVIKYSSFEPDCARDFYYGYKIEVKTMQTFQDDRWEFGAEDFSRKDSLRKQTSVSLPIVIFYDLSSFIPGSIKIILTDGELEELTGAADASCNSGNDDSHRIYLHYPISYENDEVCLNYPDNTKSCRKFSCQKSIEFQGVPTPGEYILTFKNYPDTFRIVV